ncbi:MULTISPECIES: peptidoglycan editing factor PgeF [Alcaligenes]|uniref:peptidoglycan editing factor PgeF n=1 Tax=Alcaligenes TaxID=507 RepID=UPI001EF0B7FC|nr:peptidoglycan editing factor PgeF [Alcaligenes faecalis]ULH07891.1 peptidoglycan editing factor PgeF [Alcaligenes faecalis]
MAHSKLIPGVSGPEQAGLLYFCTTRAGGVSQDERDSLNLGLNTGDDPERVQVNRQRLADFLGLEPVWLAQIHGTDVLDADQDVLPAMPRQFDAAITTRRDRTLAILTADCLPVVIWDEQSQVLGVAHAGWRGLQAGVLERTWQAMAARCPQAQSWQAWIGPAISQEHFEVGQEVFDAYVQDEPELAAFFIQGKRPGKWQADLPGIARHRLEKLSPGKMTVHLSGLCTFQENGLFYSYRRSPLTGRQATIARLNLL